MGFNIFACDTLEYDHERKQMDQLIHYLDLKFGNERENCTLIIEPRIPFNVDKETFHKTPDGLIIKDNVICLFDLKNFDNEIIADCREGKAWKSDGKIIKNTLEKNPYSQAEQYHEKFLDYLNNNILSENLRNNGKKWSRRNLHSWIVTSQLSKIEVIRNEKKGTRFFNVLAVEEFANQIAFLHSKYKQTSRNRDKIITALGATKVTIDEWYRLHSETGKRPKGLINKISQMMENTDGQTQLKALNYIRELELYQHRTHIVRCIERSPYEKIRREALLILIEWQDISLGNIFNTTLKDSSETIVNFTLEYLSKEGYSETFETLSEMLITQSNSSTSKILKAISNSGHKDSGKTIFDYAKRTFFNKPFKQFQNLSKLNQEARADESREKWNEYIDIINERNRMESLLKTTIDCLGETQHQESESWLIKIIINPSSLGYITDDYSKLEETREFSEIFGSACAALGVIGSKNQRLASFLLEKLPFSPEYYQYSIIELLGNFGVESAVSTLSRYLDEQESRLYSVTVRALESIGTQEAFNVLSKAYITKPDSYEGVITGQALWTINEEGFVDVILEQVQLDTVTNDVKLQYLQSLTGSVSLRCANVLFELLKQEEISGHAGWNLSYLTENKEIFDRLMEITYSSDKIEQSGALDALDKHFIKNPEELERFETEDALESTRRTIAYYYSKSNSKEKLFKYVKDPVKEIRNIAFRYISNTNYFGEFIVANDKKEMTTGRVAVEEEYIGIETEEEVIVIPKKDIIETGISVFDQYHYGLYLKTKSQEIEVENMLLVPRYKDSWFAKDTITRLESEINCKISSNLSEISNIPILWDSAKPNLPEKPKQYWQS